MAGDYAGSVMTGLQIEGDADLSSSKRAVKTGLRKVLKMERGVRGERRDKSGRAGGASPPFLWPLLVQLVQPIHFGVVKGQMRCWLR